MKVTISILIIGIVIFANSFYNNYFYAKDIIIFKYNMSSIEYIFCFYIFLVSIFLLLFILKREIFIDKKAISKLILLNILNLSILLYIGEYTFSIFTQFIFLFTHFRKARVFNYLYFLLIHCSLILIFSSENFTLYFLFLSILIYYIYKETSALTRQKVFIYLAITSTLIFSYIYLENFIYDVYVYIDIVDKANNISNHILLLLILLHSIILTYLYIKKKKIQKFKYN